MDTTQEDEFYDDNMPRLQKYKPLKTLRRAIYSKSKNYK